MQGAKQPEEQYTWRTPHTGTAYSPTRDLGNPARMSCVAVILSGPFTNHSTGLILKSLPPPPILCPLIFAEMDLQRKYPKRNNYLCEHQKHNALRMELGVGQDQKKGILYI